MATEQSRFNVTAADLKSYDWQVKLAQATNKKCWAYVSIFTGGAQECAKKGDDLGHRVYGFLHAVASFHPNYDAAGNTFGPMWSDSGGRRTLMADDLTDGDLDALRGILEEIIDPEFRARCGDVLWESRKGEFKAAQIAVSAYLESAWSLKSEDLWPPFLERLDRAAQLSAKLGFNQPLHRDVILQIESTIEEFKNNQKSGLLCHGLISLLLEHTAPRPEYYAQLAERMAGDFAAAKQGEFSHAYWKQAENLWRVSKKTLEEKRCALSAAESLITAAEEALKDEVFGLERAVRWMAIALQELRQAQAPQARKDEIHLRLLELEKESLSKLNPMEIRINDIPGFRENEAKVQEEAQKHVQGHSLENAIGRLVYMARPTDLKALTKQVLDEEGQFIFQNIIGACTLDYSGKVTDKLPPKDDAEGIDSPEFEKRMFQSAKRVQWPMRAIWWIEPARFAIQREHVIRRRDLIFLCANNPFIPSGHEGIYLRGIQSGFLGDWLTAMHLLIPQLEASLRYVLHQYKVVTTSMLPDGTQKDLTLNELFKIPKLKEIFGEEIIFDLRGLMVENFGHNMRNEIAHGLMPEGAFYQPAVVLLWGLTLRLCWTGYLSIQPK